MTLDLRSVSRLLGSLLIVLSALLAVISVFAIASEVSAAQADHSAFYALLISAGLGALFGGILYVTGRKPGEMIGQRGRPRRHRKLSNCTWLPNRAVKPDSFWIPR